MCYKLLFACVCEKVSSHAETNIYQFCSTNVLRSLGIKTVFHFLLLIKQLKTIHFYIPSSHNAPQRMYKMAIYMEQQLVPDLLKGNHWQNVLVYWRLFCCLSSLSTDECYSYMYALVCFSHSKILLHLLVICIIKKKARNDYDLFIVHVDYTKSSSSIPTLLDYLGVPQTQ